MKIVVKNIEELTDSELQIINKYRIIEFNTSELIGRPRGRGHSNALFLLLVDNDKILAFGKIEELNFTFQKEVESIHKVSTIISIHKGKGHGRILMEAVKKYSIESGKSLVGFCETTLLPFYRKCGFDILSSSMNKFVYVDRAGKIIPNIVPGEVFYLKGKDQLMSRILQSTKNDLVLINLSNK